MNVFSDHTNPDSLAFYWDSFNGWALGSVLTANNFSIRVNGQSYCSTPIKRLQNDNVITKMNCCFIPKNEEVVNEDVSDLCQLSEVHESTVVNCLFKRFENGNFYTNINNVLVAISPNDAVSSFPDSSMRSYRDGSNSSPHPWKTAQRAYSDMQQSSSDQCIVLVGRMGSEKRNIANAVVQYLSLASPDTQKAIGNSVASEKEKHASVILEAFGNAKTVGDDSSSRYGKITTIQYNKEIAVGSHITTTPLQLSRIVKSVEGERIYHSFYMLVKGCDSSKYELKKTAEQYKICKSGNCTETSSINDEKQFDVVSNAMRELGFNGDLIDDIWKTVAGCLHLGNVSFIDQDRYSCSLTGKAALASCCKSWQVDTETLSEELISSYLIPRDGPVIQSHTSPKAMDLRDSVIKATYDGLFSVLVNLINSKTNINDVETEISVVNLCEFENLDLNNLEQFCINVGAETLNDSYQSHVFKKEISTRMSEGVSHCEGPLSEHETPDSFKVIHAIFNSYENDFSSSFEKLSETCQQHNSFKIQNKYNKSFTLQHRSDNVAYNTEPDHRTIKPLLTKLMRASNNTFIASLLPEESKVSSSISQFKHHLLDIIEMINYSKPTWITCIKPHPAKTLSGFDGVAVAKQVRELEIVRTVEMAQSGFQNIMSIRSFVEKYGGIKISSNPIPESTDLTSLRVWCRSLCDHLGIKTEHVHIGKSKVFLKFEAHNHLQTALSK